MAQHGYYAGRRLGSDTHQRHLLATLRNPRTDVWLAHQLVAAKGFWHKAKGLLGRRELTSGSGLYIAPCGSIHSFFMQFPFDAIFVDGAWCVLHLIPAMPPYRISPIVRGARGVIELPAGTIEASETRVGDTLEFVDDGA